MQGKLDILEKNKDFDSLCFQVASCLLCQRMSNSSRILNRSVGNLNSDIMFIGEAPGRLGADSSGIPFHGDRAGHNFESLLEFARIDRNQIYVTNAVLCNPRDSKGNNATPNKAEISNCSGFLKKQIEIVNPKIIVTLGAKALEALSNIENHNLSLRDSVRSANSWNKRVLIPCYHPGQRAMIHRSFANQRSDYQFIHDTLKSQGKRKNNYANQKTNQFTSIIVEYILSMSDEISYFALHKIFYLLEYNYYAKHNKRLTSSYIVRQKDGPYCTDLHIKKLTNSIPDLETRFFKNGSIRLRKNRNKLFAQTLLDEYELDNEVEELIDRIVKKYGSLSMGKLKNAVYLTRPMRNILYLEKEKKVNLYNSPIEFTTLSVY